MDPLLALPTLSAFVCCDKTGAGKHVPRAIFVDLDQPLLIESEHGLIASSSTLNSPFLERKMLPTISPEAIIQRGKRLLMYAWTESASWLINCTGLQGFLVFNAVGGGTGSGLGSLLLERLSLDYGKKSKLGFTIYTSPQVSTAVVEHYKQCSIKSFPY